MMDSATFSCVIAVRPWPIRPSSVSTSTTQQPSASLCWSPPGTSSVKGMWSAVAVMRMIFIGMVLRVSGG
jgi:hypothetical protein